MAITILQIPELDLLEAANILEWLFMLIPQYNLGYGIIQISTNSQLQKICPIGLNPLFPLFDCTADSESPRYSIPCCEKCKFILIIRFKSFKVFHFRIICQIESHFRSVWLFGLEASRYWQKHTFSIPCWAWFYSYSFH